MFSLSSVKTWLLGLVPALVAVVAAFLFGSYRASKEAEIEEASKELHDHVEASNKRVDSVKVSNDVQSEVIARSDSSVDDELQQWCRDDKNS